MGNQSSVSEEEQFHEILTKCKGSCRDKWNAVLHRIEAPKSLIRASRAQCAAFRNTPLLPADLIQRVVSFVIVPLASVSLKQDISSTDTSFYAYNLGIMANMLRLEWSLQELDLSGSQIPFATHQSLANVLITSPHKHRLRKLTMGRVLGQIQLTKQGALDCRTTDLSQKLECRGTQNGTALGYLTGMMLAGPAGVCARLDISSNDLCHAGLGSWPWMMVAKMINGADSLTSLNLSNTAMCGIFYQPETRRNQGSTCAGQASGVQNYGSSTISKSGINNHDVKPAILLARHLACAYFEPLSSLTELNLSANALGTHKPSLTAILSAVGVSSTLTSVDLSDNSITDSSEVSSLVIARTCTLFRLVLDNNPLGGDSATDIEAAIAGMNSKGAISVLGLKNCGILPESVAQIAVALAARAAT
jgi:hypothetical protein